MNRPTKPSSKLTTLVWINRPSKVLSFQFAKMIDSQLSSPRHQWNKANLVSSTTTRQADNMTNNKLWISSPHFGKVTTSSTSTNFQYSNTPAHNSTTKLRVVTLCSLLYLLSIRILSCRKILVKNRLFDYSVISSTCLPATQLKTKHHKKSWYKMTLLTNQQ